MKKSPESPDEQKHLADLEFPSLPHDIVERPRLTLDEYDRLNEMGRDFMPPSPESRIGSANPEEFVL